MRGQVPLMGTVMVSLATIVASAFAAWGTSSTRANDIDTKVEIVKTTENLHYQELVKQMAESERRQNERWDRVESVLNKIAPATIVKNKSVGEN